MHAAQPRLQRTWLHQNKKRRENLSLNRVYNSLGAKAPSPLNKPIYLIRKRCSLQKRLFFISPYKTPHLN
jgi:hypothetical protein